MGNPTYRYKVIDGTMKAEVFDSDDLPKDWYDSPGKAEEEANKPPVKRTRKKTQRRN